MNVGTKELPNDMNEWIREERKKKKTENEGKKKNIVKEGSMEESKN